MRYTSYTERAKVLRRLKEIEVIRHEKVTLRSGAAADYYCDIKKAFGFPDILNARADAAIERLPIETTCVAASRYGGLPLGAIVASRSEKHFVSVRKGSKGYGLTGVLSGYVPEEKDHVVIVDDVLTSGSGVTETYTLLANNNIWATCAIILVARAEPVPPLPHSSLFLVDELLA